MTAQRRPLISLDEGAESGTRGRHIVLIGLPGAGKSASGALAARQLRLAFVDLDSEIEARAGKSIEAIFHDDGEEAFRRLETEATRALVGRGNAVVATGAGWVERPRNVELLRPPARLVHLAVSPRTAVARMGGAVTLRPLLAARDPVVALTALALRRARLYAAADFELDTEVIDLQQVVNFLVDLALRWGTPIG